MMKPERALMLAASAAGGLVLLALLYVQGPHAGWLPECQFHKLTGLSCPGCGMTRATHAALHGRLGEAFRYNPLGVVLLPVLMGGIAMEMWGRARGVPTRWRFRGTRWLWAMLAALLVFGVLRNIPAWPFTLLAPP